MTKPLQERALRHGHTSSGRVSPTYNSWSHMKRRCLDATHPAWENYGGRGITVHQRWLSFDAFLADMGEKPPGTSIDRIDNSRGYEPGNCRWATRAEQNANQRRNRRRLAEDAERDVYERIERGELIKDIAARYGINKNGPREIWKRVRRSL